MQVFVAGATGVLGRRLVAELADDHDVVGLVRDETGAATVEAAGGEPRRGDVLDRESVAEAAAGSDVLVHAATKIPTDANPDDEAWAYNDRVRRDGAANLVAAAGDVGADRVIVQSVVWVARQPDGSPFDEDADPHPDRSTRTALEAERIVEEGAEDFDPVVLRGGWFYAHDTAHTRQFGADLLARTVAAPSELPIGVVTAFIGAPFFAVVLRSSRRGVST
jgi:nucleoside-diphosphate-sugar epimerase